MRTAFFETAMELQGEWLLLSWVLGKTWWKLSHDTQEPNTQGLRGQTMSKLQQTDEMKHN